MPSTIPYTSGFFESIAGGSLSSARGVLPIVLEQLHPRSMVDIGCGTGAWLSVAKEMGVDDILGIDGDYVDRAALLIPAEHFRAGDVGAPLSVGRRFDCVLSLEVGEHLPIEKAETYVDNLVSFGDRIVFSAAIPDQGGTGHINEQWPEYWQALFAKRGYSVVDCLRHRVWNNRDVERWYRQNLLLFVKDSALREDPALQREADAARGRALSMVHPALYLSPSLRQVIRMIPRVISRGLQRRLRKRK